MDSLDELRKMVHDHGKRIAKLEGLLQSHDDKKVISKSHKIPENVLRLIVKNLKTVTSPQLVMVILNFHGTLPKSQQLEIFKRLGKETNTFKGGAYTRDLIKKGFVHELNKIDNETVYGLTEKGKAEANLIIEKLEKNNNEKK